MRSGATTRSLGQSEVARCAIMAQATKARGESAPPPPPPPPSYAATSQLINHLGIAPGATHSPPLPRRYRYNGNQQYLEPTGWRSW
jgi:hypothetical protein